MTAGRQAGERTRIATLIVMASVGGYIDAASYLGLGRVFTAAMTGNTVLLALAAVQHDWPAALRSGVALVSFVVGVALGQVVVDRFAARAMWPRAVGAGLALELLLLVVLAAGWHLLDLEQGGRTTHLLIVVSALAIGVQSATARRLGVADVSTTYVTGTLTALTAGAVQWFRRPPQQRGRQDRQPEASSGALPVYGPILPASAWVIYAAGALLGSLMVTTWRDLAIVPAVLVVAALMMLDRRAAP